MKEIIEKISSYNIFNYLFPGIIFVILLREITSYDLIQENNFFGAFLYYFIGLGISRIGSLVIEDLLKSKTFKFIIFVDYKEFVHACDKDKKIELFSEINNMYRTIISLLTLLLLAKVFENLSNWFNISQSISYILLIIGLLILFVLSYRKQTGYIVKRVASRNEKI